MRSDTGEPRGSRRILPLRRRSRKEAGPLPRVRLAEPSGARRSIVRMCGRYTITRVDGHGIAQRFGVHERAVERETLGRYNVCPTERVLAVCADGDAPEARGLRWGLVPPCARALGAGYEPINARVETVASKRPFAELVARPDRRCLVVA